MAQLLFNSKENKSGILRRGGDRLRYSVASVRSKYKDGNTTEVSAANMLFKLGLCAAACALVLVLNNDVEYTEEQANILGNETEEAERPGTLKFVQFPGILSVFSTEKSYAYPISSCDASFIQDDRLMCLYSKDKQNVCAVEAGIVLDTGDNGEAGSFISVKTDTEQIWYYSGLSSLRAEIGQRLGANDTIGEAGKDTTLYIRCEEKGIPVDIQKMFAADGSL